jgi:uncharacterized membrane protein
MREGYEGMRNKRGNGRGDGVFVFVGVYDDPDEAEVDYEAVKQLHHGGVIGTYDAAVVDREADGKVHVHKHEKPTQRGAWSGLAAGALLGIFFPPGLIAAGAVGAATGGVIGHLWKGMSRKDVKELGETLDTGEAALIVVGESKLSDAMAKAMKRANRTMEREIDADAAGLRRELDNAIDQARATA